MVWGGLGDLFWGSNNISPRVRTILIEGLPLAARGGPLYQGYHGLPMGCRETSNMLRQADPNPEENSWNPSDGFLV